MKSFLICYVVALLVFCALDALWLGVFAYDFYQQQIGSLLLPHPNFVAAAAFYLVFLAGVVVFVVQPAISAHSLPRAVFMGALFGLITYATYDVTNLATLRGWTECVVAADLAWGAFVTGCAAAAAYIAHSFTTH